MDNLWITLGDRGINTPLQVHDLAFVKKGSSRLDQGIDRSEGDGIRELIELRGRLIDVEEYPECRTVGRLGGVLLDDVCCCSRRDCECRDAKDRGTGVGHCSILATGNVGP